MIFVLGKDFDIGKIYSLITDEDYRGEVVDLMNNYLKIKKEASSFNSLKSGNQKKLLFPIIKDILNISKKYLTFDIIYDSSVCPTCLDIVCNCKKTTKVKTKNEYEDEENFLRSLMKYQGKQSKKIDFIDLEKQLDSFFIKYGFPIGKNLKRERLERLERKKGDESSDSHSQSFQSSQSSQSSFKPTVMMMIDVLQKIGKSNLYEDINLICHEYWGFELPDIEEFMEQLINDYRKTQKVYLKLEKTRKSCLNLQYRIFKHLQLLNIDVHQEDFRIPGTPDILKYHDQLWKEMCAECGLIFIPTI